MISELFVSPFTGIFLTIFFFLIGRALYSRWQIPLFNPLIFAIICIILLLMVTNTSYEDYYILDCGLRQRQLRWLLN